MHLDKWGLPVQANGDANDQLQRVGMISVGLLLGGDKSALNDAPLTHPEFALRMLQTRDGIYKRHVEGNTNNVSADQLIGALAYWVAARKWPQVYFMLRECIKRFGFAQNYKDGLNDDTSTKVPDFMLLRTLPLFARISWVTYPLALLSDLYLVGAALFSAIDRNPDHVDDNNLILTLAVCDSRMRTPLSALACYLYGKLRPWNYGCGVWKVNPPVCMVETLADGNRFSPVFGALRWYHRADSGGNPEVAELWKPIIERIFG